MQKQIKSYLSQTDLFDNLTEEQLDKIEAITEAAILPKDIVLIEEKDTSDALFVVASGSVSIWLNPSIISAEAGTADSVMVAELVSGQVFGEMALVDQGMRSATVQTTQENTYILRLPREKLIELCDSDIELGYKIMKNLAADLALKMRNTGLTLRQYQMILSQEDKE
jgi:CRP-like cAMP-binding protein